MIEKDPNKKETIKKAVIRLKREKIKSSIQTTMNEIYQEQDKKSRLIKYLVNPSFSSILCPKNKLNVKTKTFEDLLEAFKSSHTLNSDAQTYKLLSDYYPETPSDSSKLTDINLIDKNILNLDEKFAENEIRQKEQEKKKLQPIEETNNKIFFRRIFLGRKELPIINSERKIMTNDDNQKNSAFFNNYVEEGIKNNSDRIIPHFLQKKFQQKDSLLSLQERLKKSKKKGISLKELTIKNRLKISLSLSNSKGFQTERSIEAKTEENFETANDLYLKMTEELTDRKKRKNTNLLESLKMKYSFIKKSGNILNDNLQSYAKKLGLCKKSKTSSKIALPNLSKNGKKDENSEKLYFSIYDKMNREKSNKSLSIGDKFGLFYKKIDNYYQKEIFDSEIFERKMNNNFGEIDSALKKLNDDLEGGELQLDFDDDDVRADKKKNDSKRFATNLNYHQDKLW